MKYSYVFFFFIFFVDLCYLSGSVDIYSDVHVSPKCCVIW